MAKIDTTKIEGFDGMSAEDKLNALLTYEMPDAPTAEENSKLKALLSKSNTEAANYKRQMLEKDEALKAKMTEAEKAEAERAERDKQMQEELSAYKAKERLATYATKLMANGFDAEAAAKMAAGLPEGVTDDYFSAQGAFLASMKQTMESQALNKQPGLSTGTPPKPKADAELADARRAAGLPT
jgi:hypothetical protein